MDFHKAYLLIAQKLSTWLRELIRLLPNILLASLILVLGLFIAKWLRKLSVKLIHRFSAHASLNNLMASVIYVFFVGVTLFTVLTVLQLDKAVTSILAGAGILGLALAFAFQDIASNFISGIFLSFRHPIRVGHIIKVKDFTGKVEEINLRDTVIRTFQGQMVILPNKEVFQNPIENYSILGKRRFDLIVGVSFAEDLEQVKAVALKAVATISGLSTEDETTLFYNEIGDSTINFQLRLWLASPEQAEYLRVGSEAIICIKKAFDAANIVMPSPIRTLDFGIKGGVPLSDMLTSLKP